MSLALTLLAYFRTLWLTRPGQGRAAFLRGQDRRYGRWLRKSLPKVAFYANGTLPLTDKALVMQYFADFNRAGITATQGWAAFATTRKISALTVGASTGTSGNRGLFILSDAERFQWLGVILAKALPRFWGQKVAVMLPLHTALYDTARQTRCVDLQFYDLTAPRDEWLARLRLQNPGVIVAPPKVLIWLTQQTDLHPPYALFGRRNARPSRPSTDRGAFWPAAGADLHGDRGTVGGNLPSRDAASCRGRHPVRI